MTYHSEEVQQILQIALTHKQEKEFSREQLIEIASELDISTEALQSAEQEWSIQRTEAQRQHMLNTRQRKEFKSHLTNFIAVNIFLVLLNLVISPLYFWAIFPLLGWGLSLFFHGWKVYRNRS
jgi:Flp pilus assembly protein TadB